MLRVNGPTPRDFLTFSDDAEIQINPARGVGRPQLESHQVVGALHVELARLVKEADLAQEVDPRIALSLSDIDDAIVARRLDQMHKNGKSFILRNLKRRRTIWANQQGHISP